MIEEAAKEVALQVAGIGLAVMAVSIVYLVCDWRARRRVNRATLGVRLIAHGLVETQHKK